MNNYIFINLLKLQIPYKNLISKLSWISTKMYRNSHECTGIYPKMYRIM